MTDLERKKLEKEAAGLRAKLRWDHMAEGLKAVWRERIAEIERMLRDTTV